jgi:hypothetical protein
VLHAFIVPVVVTENQVSNALENETPLVGELIAIEGEVVVLSRLNPL